MKTYKFNINKKPFEVIIHQNDFKVATLEVNGKKYEVEISDIKNSVAEILKQKQKEIIKAPPLKPNSSSQNVSVPKPLEDRGVRAPIPGLIRMVFVKTGDKIKVGSKIVMMEAMKMENIISSKIEGTVTAVLVVEGDSVAQDQLMIQVE